MKKIISNPYVIGFVFGCLALTFIKLTSVLTETAPPPLVDVGEWQLTDHNNNKFGSENLKNKVF